MLIQKEAVCRQKPASTCQKQIFENKGSLEEGKKKRKKKVYIC